MGVPFSVVILGKAKIASIHSSVTVGHGIGVVDDGHFISSSPYVSSISLLGAMTTPGLPQEAS